MPTVWHDDRFDDFHGRHLGGGRGPLYACGDEQVREYALSGDKAEEAWRWTASQAPDLPAEYRSRLLAHIDDCKPVEGGKAILVTASEPWWVLIDRASGKVRFRATAPDGAFGDLLPGGYAGGGAGSINKAGDRLELYKLARNEKPLLSQPLPSGHVRLGCERQAPVLRCRMT